MFFRAAQQPLQYAQFVNNSGQKNQFQRRSAGELAHDAAVFPKAFRKCRGQTRGKFTRIQNTVRLREIADKFLLAGSDYSGEEEEFPSASFNLEIISSISSRIALKET